MAFKSIEEFNDSKYHGVFRLINDGEGADVIFLYESIKDVLVGPAHYIKSSDYSGYVHCCERGCPACNKGVRVQRKLFIPLYNIDKDEIQFWDRNMKFEPQLQKDVFSRFPNPSEFVFRITRHGEPNDINTRYSIEATAKNTIGSYNDILAKFNAKMPDYYSNIIKEMSISELSQAIQNTGNESSGSGLPEYTPIPRAGYQSTIPDTFVDTSSIVTDNAPTEAPITNYTPASDINPSSDDSEEDLPDPIF